MTNNIYYAVAQSPLLYSGAIYTQWKDAEQVCINKETNKPLQTAIFKKFHTINEADTFIHEYKLKNILVNEDKKKKRMNDNVSSSSMNIKRSHIAQPVGHVDSNPPTIIEPLHIYTDGACSNNGKRGALGGYGVFFSENDKRNTFGPLPGNHATHTNQRAELTAILKALEIVKEDPRLVILHSDSKYSMECITSWLPKWTVNGFRTANGTPVKNLDLIQSINNLIKKRGSHLFQFQYVPGHQGDPGNTSADTLAKLGASMAMNT